MNMNILFIFIFFLIILNNNNILLINGNYIRYIENENIIITTTNKDRIKKNSEIPINERPIIGIMTQPLGTNETSNLRYLKYFQQIQNNIPSDAKEYIAGSYVKWVEAGGARVVPIRYTLSASEKYKLYKQLNGILLPGGGASLVPKESPYYESGKLFWNWILDDAAKIIKKNQLSSLLNNNNNNNNDDESPPALWGTCLGFEEISVLAAGSNYSVLESSGIFQSEDQPLPLLNMQKDVRQTNRLFEHISPMLLEKIQYINSTYNSHEMGVDPILFKQNPNLMEFFQPPLAYGKDKNNKPFVAIIESKKETKTNIFGVQFHPEKPIFEWSSNTNIPHNQVSTDFGLYLSRFFVQQAKKNLHKVIGGPKIEEKLLIENGGPDGKGKRIYIGSDSYFMEMFVW